MVRDYTWQDSWKQSKWGFNKLFFSFLLVLMGTISQINAQQLSDRAKVSLLTIAPAKELYNQFGHTAIRIYDPERGIDICYNYGTYDFNTPNFYSKFVRGQLNYVLWVVPTARELEGYQKIQRGVIEQDFNLNPEEVQKVADFLRENFKEENRYYLYDFFYDNCATRVRDLFENVLDTRFAYQEQGIPNFKSFRMLLDEKIHSTPWNDFGIDFILGSPTDVTAGFREEMFLPEYLAKNMTMSKYKGENLLGPPKVIIENGIEIGSNTWLSPLNVFTLLLVLVIIGTIWGSPHLKKGMDIFFFSIFTFCGFFLLFMRLGTEHFSTWQNYNMLWANPLHIVVLLNMRLKIRWVDAIKWLLFAMAINNLIVYFVPPQGFHPAILPLLGIIILRLSDQLGLLKRKKKKRIAQEERPETNDLDTELANIKDQKL